MDKAAAMRELKKLSGETGLFDGISDEEIEASVGVSYQDVTQLRDPISGLGGEVSDPFDVPMADSMTIDYKGQPREENGRFTFGKLGGKRNSVLKKKSKSDKMGKIEVRRVSSGILTDHPQLQPGEIRFYEYGTHRYQFEVQGPGEYIFLSRKRLK